MFRRPILSRGRRLFATETKSPFRAPPPPPQSTGSTLTKFVIGGGGMLALGYVFMLPENNYDMLGVPQVNERSDTPPGAGNDEKQPR
jgi:hypothetical protein